MSGDFFNALAQRAISPPAVRPRLASRFEGGAGVGMDEQQERVEAAAASTPTPVTPLRPERTAPDVAFDPPVRPLPIPSRTEPAAPVAALPPQPIRPIEATPTETTKPRRRAAPEKEVSGLAPVARLAPTSMPEPAAAPVAVRPSVVERVVHERVEQQQTTTLRSLIESRVVERLTVEPSRAQSATAPAPSAMQIRQQAETPAPPRVEIHIGRIEVMPASAPAAEPTRIETPQPPQSLDAYLAQRRRP